MRAVRLTQAHWLNDRSAGDVNDIRFLPDEEARDLVEVWRMAVYAPEYDPPGAPPAQDIPAVQEPEDSVTPEFEEAVTDFMDKNDALLRRLEDDPVPVQEPDALSRPWVTANKATWIDWALNGDHGQPKPSPEEAAGMTKAQLTNKYGDTL